MQKTAKKTHKKSSIKNKKIAAETKTIQRIRLHMNGASLRVILCSLAIGAIGTLGLYVYPLVTPSKPVAVSAPIIIETKAPVKHAGLDSVMSAQDSALYEMAIAAQKKADWTLANTAISQLKNTALVSSLLSDRYLNAKYTSNFDELKIWLEANANHPDAPSIRRLAAAKNPKAAKSLPSSANSNFSARSIDEGKASILRVIEFSINDANPLAQKVANKVLVSIETGKSGEALKVIDSAHTRHVINDRTRAILLGRAASYHFRRGNYSEAYHIAASAASATNEPFAAHQWLAGISAMHMKQPNTALRHFSRIAKRDDLPVADKAAALYWASIAQRKTKNNGAADQSLEEAAKFDRTFYGILAQKALGDSMEITHAPDLDESALLEIPAVLRAASWLELGNESNAAKELVQLFVNSEDTDLKQQIIALAAKWDMPMLQMKMGASMRSADMRLDFAAYPMPGWKPNAGYAVDPALLYAIARQESKFDSDARSPAGAMGIMQLMPTTAQYVAKSALQSHERSNLKSRLNEPVTSIALGQEYLQYLMKKPYIDNNLMFVAAAYNAGPGKVAEWKGRMELDKDPLLFLESISFTETRNYVQQVFVNYWVYSELMGEESPTLEALASNNWPIYQATNLEFAGLFEDRVN